jgi:protein TonB
MVACAHIAALWLAFQVPEVRQVMRQVAPLMVDLIAPREPDRVTPPPPQPAPSMRPAARPLQRPSPILAAPTAESDAPATFATAPPLAEPAPLPPPSATAPAVATPAPPPQARRVLPATAVQYLVLPPVEVPRASRRAGESGMVWLKVVVGVQGLPLSVQVQRSSGYPRLDEQAVWAMRQARFKPQTENGSPIELEVTAPIEYPLE